MTPLALRSAAGWGEYVCLECEATYSPPELTGQPKGECPDCAGRLVEALALLTFIERIDPGE